MFEDTYPVQWLGRQAVVTLPEHIDVSNADQIREELLSVINRGAASLIADMTATLSCDYAGVNTMVRAYKRALVSGTQLRLVVTAQIVHRMLDINGLDRLISIYPSLEAAIAAGAPTATLPSGLQPTEAGAGCQAPTRHATRARRRQQRAAGTLHVALDGWVLFGASWPSWLASRTWASEPRPRTISSSLPRPRGMRRRMADRRHRAICASSTVTG
jgi:anti-sigma B factor antagonist